MENKRKNGLVITVIILIVLVLIMGAYIVCNNIVNKNDINLNQELETINTELKEYGGALGYLAIVRGDKISTVLYNTNLLDDYKNRQLFVMEYILSDVSNYNKFSVLAIPSLQLVTDLYPTDDLTLAYIRYNEFNNYYKKLFGEDFNLATSLKSSNIYNTSMYDNDYVYYENVRSGLNGVNVSSIVANSVVEENNIFEVDLTMTYSDRASSMFNKSNDKATLEYTKDNNGNIILKSFTVNK